MPCNLPLNLASSYAIFWHFFHRFTKSLYFYTSCSKSLYFSTLVFSCVKFWTKIWQKASTKNWKILIKIQKINFDKSDKFWKILRSWISNFNKLWDHKFWDCEFCDYKSQKIIWWECNLPPILQGAIYPCFVFAFVTNLTNFW